MSDVLEDWEWAKINLRATPAGKNAAGDALAAELTALRARAGQCRACRTMGGPDVRCDACADSGLRALAGPPTTKPPSEDEGSID